MKVKLLKEEAKLPTLGSSESIGFDLYSTTYDFWMLPNVVYRIDTGVAIELPSGFWGMLCDRSSMASDGIHVLGGIIDPDYRGELKVVLINLTREPIEHKMGQKVCQLVLIPILRQDYKDVDPVRCIELVDELSVTDRGDKGFGSTGK